MSLTPYELREIVLACLKRVAPEADFNHLDSHRSFQEQMSLDSVDYLNFVLAIEDQLGVRISESDYPRLSSLDGCLAHLGSIVSPSHHRFET